MLPLNDITGCRESAWHYLSVEPCPLLLVLRRDTALNQALFLTNTLAMSNTVIATLLEVMVLTDDLIILKRSTSWVLLSEIHLLRMIFLPVFTEPERLNRRATNP